MEPDEKQSCVELLKDNSQRTRRILRLTEAVIREVDAVDQKNEELARRIFGGDPTKLGIEPGRGTGKMARNLRVEKCGNGSFRFFFDVGLRIGGEAFELPPQLGGFLYFLATAPPVNGLVGWRSQAEVLEYLKAESDTAHRKRVATGLIYRLREALAGKKYDRDLIERNPKQGVRFAAEPGIKDK